MKVKRDLINYINKNKRIIKVQYVIREEQKFVFCIITNGFGTFKGKAKCADEDVFNINTGKKIAYHRALRQANAYIRNLLKQEIILPAYAICSDIIKDMDRSADILRQPLSLRCHESEHQLEFMLKTYLARTRKALEETEGSNNPPYQLSLIDIIDSCECILREIR